MNQPTGHIPDWKLERLALGELPPGEAKALMAQLQGTPGGLERLEALEVSNAAILEALPPQDVSREVSRRARQAQGDAALSRKGLAKRVGPIVAALAMGAMALAIVPLSSQDSSVTGASQGGAEALEVTRAKGIEAGLVIHRLQGRDVERLSDGDGAAGGDVLQVSYRSAGAAYGAILSMDGRGVLTLHHPTRGRRSPALTSGGSITLPRSYQLDDAPDFERFVLITSEAPFDLQLVKDAARQVSELGDDAISAPLPLPEGLNQVDFTVRKL